MVTAVIRKLWFAFRATKYSLQIQNFTFHELSDSRKKQGVEVPLLDAIIALKIQMEGAQKLSYYVRNFISI